MIPDDNYYPKHVSLTILLRIKKHTLFSYFAVFDTLNDVREYIACWEKRTIFTRFLVHASYPPLYKWPPGPTLNATTRVVALN